MKKRHGGGGGGCKEGKESKEGRKGGGGVCGGGRFLGPSKGVRALRDLIQHPPLLPRGPPPFRPAGTSGDAGPRDGRTRMRSDDSQKAGIGLFRTSGGRKRGTGQRGHAEEKPQRERPHLHCRGPRLRDGGGGGGVEAQRRQPLLRRSAQLQQPRRPARGPHHGERRQLRQPQRLRGRERKFALFNQSAMVFEGTPIIPAPHDAGVRR